jgi:fermentation-respiration switch protein FrsA (DUF1100 family)
LPETRGKIKRVLSMPIGPIHLLILVLALFAAFVLFYDRIENFFVFYPDGQFESLPQNWQLTHEEASFIARDGTQLHGWFFPLQGEGPVILFCHGNAGNISHRLENVKLLLDQKLRVFIFDYRGYGRSRGRPSEKGIYQDGLAAYDFLNINKKIAPKLIVPFGRSLGASVAVEIALQREVPSLITESAFTSTKEMARTIPLFMPFSFIAPRRFDNLEKITRVRVPKLIIHGEQDEIVPFYMGQRLYEAAGSKKYFLPIKGAGHNDTYVVGGGAYFETLAGFIRNSKIPVQGPD